MPSVMDTAAAIACIRAEEGQRPDGVRLFDDPYARLFARVGDGDEATRLFLAVPFFREAIRLRTRVIDDVLRDAVRAGTRQIVILGVGFDCRALRLPEIGAHDARVFEVDFAAQLATKQAILERAGVALPAWVRAVGCDFGDPAFEHELPASLAAAGFRLRGGAAVVWEGVTGYLDDASVDRTLRVVAACGGPGTVIVFNFGVNRFNPETLAARVAGAGFTRLETHSMAAMHRRYLPGVSPPGGDLHWMAIARID